MAIQRTLTFILRFFLFLTLLEIVTLLLTGGFCSYTGELSLNEFAATLPNTGMIVIVIGAVTLFGGGRNQSAAGAVGAIVSPFRLIQKVTGEYRPSVYQLASVLITTGILALVLSEVTTRTNLINSLIQIVD